MSKQPSTWSYTTTKVLVISFLFFLIVPLFGFSTQGDNLEDLVASMISENLTLEAQVSALSTQVQFLESDTTELSAEIISLESQIIVWTDEVSTLKVVDMRGVLLSFEIQEELLEALPKVKLYLSPPCNCGF